MQYVIITGVSTGIGYAILENLHQQGYYVFGSVRKAADAERLQNTFTERFMPLLFDVTNDEAVQEAVPQVERVLNGQPLTALINNAGIAVSGPLQYIPIGKIKQQFDINVFGLLRVTQAFLPMLGAKEGFVGKPGRIIHISSVSGRLTGPFTGLYSASKFAVEAISDGLRRELEPFGIESIAIQPGPIKTPIWEKAKEGGDEYLDTPYGEVFQGVDKFLENASANALPTKAVTDAVFKALTDSKPKTRYMVIKNAGIVRMISNIFPPRWVDKITISNFKKNMS
jgi:NAD(P)-dependent dehydrogenase (short-subunit alcohol dehydrogenase family)